MKYETVNPIVPILHKHTPVILYNIYHIYKELIIQIYNILI